MLLYCTGSKKAIGQQDAQKDKNRATKIEKNRDRKKLRPEKYRPEKIETGKIEKEKREKKRKTEKNRAAES